MTVKITPRVVPNDKYSQANAYEFLSLYLESESGGRVDLKTIYQNFTYVEDIYTSCISGSVLVKDAVNLFQSFPIAGYEKIVCSFRTPGIESEYITKTFDVVSVTDMVKGDNDRACVYRINFISSTGVTDKKIRISKSYKGKISDIAKKIYSEYLGGDLDVADTLNEQKFVIPRWSPFSAIEWLSKRAIPSKNPSETNYVFYEDTDGHHFVPLSVLMNKAPIMSYYSLPVQIKADPSNNTGRDIARDFSNVKQTMLMKTNQKLKEHMEGAFSSTLYVHDITTKQWGKYVYNYNSDEGKVRYTTENKTTRNQDKYVDSPSKVFLTTKQTGLMGKDFPSVQNHPEWLQRTLSTDALLETIKVKITTSGNSLLRAGSTIELFIPKSSSINEANAPWYDEYFSGKYIITTLRHVITPDDYTNVILLAKNGYETPVPDESTFMGTSKSNKPTRRIMK